jgi:enoyl-CoA hydratase/carnithine racemase
MTRVVPLVHYDVRDGVGWIELDAPPANTYSHAMMRQLDEAVLAARFDPAVQVLVLRGRGERFFCAGADIAMLRDADPTFKYHFCLHANETLNRLEQTPKLVVAALNGHAVGGGLELALAADLRVARREGGRLGLPEVRLGVLAGTGGTQRLARAVGKARAIELLATGRTFGFEEAHRLGLVHELLDEANFDANVREYVQRFLAPHAASRAIGLMKRAVQSGAEGGLHEGLALERELQQQLFLSEDAREGLAAYIEKRDPEFRGR